MYMVMAQAKRSLTTNVSPQDDQSPLPPFWEEGEYLEIPHWIIIDAVLGGIDDQLSFTVNITADGGLNFPAFAKSLRHV